MKIFDICIVGAGASGMLSARYLSKRGFNVLLLEGSSSLGKKLSMTGNGKCNITNNNMAENFYHCKDKNFIKNVLKKVDTKKLISILKEYKIYTIEKNGYVYPMSMQAKSVVEALSSFNNHVTLLLNKKVREIKKKDDIFYIYGEREKKGLVRELISCAKIVILSCGGSSYPKTGSDGSGYKLCEKLGLKINKIVPALTPLYCTNYDKNLFGIRNDVSLRLFENTKLIDSSKGEIQFTKDGLSGICVFQISKNAILSKMKGNKVTIVCDYLPNINENELFNILKSSEFRDDTFKALNTILKNKLIYHILDEEKISYDKKIRDITDEKLQSIIYKIKNDIFYINDKSDFKNAQVTGGGVDISEVNNSMESKLFKNLYVIGELLDVDGLCGGYNLHFAFSSAIISCDDILQKFEGK